MAVLKSNRANVAYSKEQCLAEFTHINHYWDGKHSAVVAKILPGEFYVSKENTPIATTLGSCVSACIWDVESQIGGMNHFMLPLTDREAHEVDWGQRGMHSDATRYGNFAMEYLINLILKNGGKKKNLQAKAFGGAKVLKNMTNIGERNIDFVLSYLEDEKIPLISSDLGSVYPRKVIFEPHTGRVLVKTIDNLHNDTITRRENDYRNQLQGSSSDGEIELF
ncbi:chemoreceptor glutamine deamidase CheD [Cognaticolwellia mytili]|uniref:chemoreceptor glutamine deamidase CheD n=1 Tax=Cognaticolwellia mytili TaxID=1888913 RepID=UPI000A177309|nr:chemoreceptor glutamine deamidase CheD [Cognaticolwellia mytili]